MKVFLIVFFLIFSVNAYSYSLGLGLIAGGGATEIEALSSKSECEASSDCITEFNYRYKMGINIINKFQISETIFLKINTSLIKFKIDFNEKQAEPFLIKTDFALEFYPLKEIIEGFYFGGGLFINYFLTSGFSEPNHGASMISAFINTGYKIPLSKRMSFFADFSVEIFDMISLEHKTESYVGLTSNIYLEYSF